VALAFHYWWRSGSISIADQPRGARTIMARKSASSVLLKVTFWLYFLNRVRPTDEAVQASIHGGGPASAATKLSPRLALQSAAGPASMPRAIAAGIRP